MDVIRGNQTLFMRRDEVEAAWNWIDPILDAWDDSRQEAQGYTAGTWGPSASIALIERDGRTWHESDVTAMPAAPRLARVRRAQRACRGAGRQTSPACWRRRSPSAEPAFSRSPAARRRRSSSRRCRQAPIDWDKVTVTLVDERFVPPTIAALECRAGARQAAAGHGGGGALRAALPSTRDSAEDGGEAGRRRACARCRGRSMRSSSAWERRPHRFVLSRTPTISTRCSTRQPARSCCRACAERRRAAADADAAAASSRRGFVALHIEGAEKRAGARARARREAGEAADPRGARRMREAGRDLLGAVSL